MVQSAFAEPASRPKEVAGALAAALAEMASWLGLERTEVRDRGDLAATLRKALPGRPRRVKGSR